MMKWWQKIVLQYLLRLLNTVVFWWQDVRNHFPVDNMFTLTVDQLLPQHLDRSPAPSTGTFPALLLPSHQPSLHKAVIFIKNHLTNNQCDEDDVFEHHDDEIVTEEVPESDWRAVTLVSGSSVTQLWFQIFFIISNTRYTWILSPWTEATEEVSVVFVWFSIILMHTLTDTINKLKERNANLKIEWIEKLFYIKDNEIICYVQRDKFLQNEAD